MKKLVVIMVLAVLLAGIPFAVAAEGDETETLTIVAPQWAELQLEPLIQLCRRATDAQIEVTYIENTADYAAKMSTEILAGGGPDLFLANDVPFWDYAKKGALADVGKFVEDDPDLDISQFHENIIDPLRDKNGNLFVMPVSYTFSLIVVNTPLLEKYGVEIPVEWTLSSMVKAAAEFTKNAKGADVHAFFGDTYLSDALMDEIMLSIDFKEGEVGADKITEELLSVLNMDCSDTWAVNQRNVAFTAYWTRFPRRFSYGDVGWGMFEYEGYEFLVSPRENPADGNMYILDLGFCVNKNGNVDAAWRFLKAALGEKIQAESINAIYHPILKSATEDRLNKNRELLAQIEQKIQNGEDFSSLLYTTTERSEDEIVPAAENYINNYTAMMASLTVPRLYDKNLADSLAVALNVGTGTLDTAAAKTEIIRIIETYLGESGGDTVQGYTIIYIAGSALAVAIAAGVAIKLTKRKKKA